MINFILKMLFVFDILSAIYVSLLVGFVGINVRNKSTLLTSIPNVAILRLWMGFVVTCVIVDNHWTWLTPFRASIEIVVCYLAEDFYGYCFHRYFHHNKYLYNNVHKMHHDNQAECFTTAFYIHPAELVGFYFVGVIIGPGILSTISPYGISWLGLTMWFFLAEFYLFWSHTGYENPSLPWLPSTKFHNDHHRFYNCNYSSVYMDGVMGTLRPASKDV